MPEAGPGPLAQRILDLQQFSQASRVVDPTIKIPWEDLYVFPLEPADRFWVARYAPKSLHPYLFSESPLFDAYSLRGKYIGLDHWNAIAVATGSVGFWCLGSYALEVADPDFGQKIWASLETKAHKDSQRNRKCMTTVIPQTYPCQPRKINPGNHQLPRARRLYRLKRSLRHLNIPLTPTTWPSSTP